MAKNNEVGVALLRIAPTLRGFVDQLREDLNKSRPAWPDVELEVKPKNLDSFVAKIRAAVQAAKDDIEIDVDASTGDATAHIDAWKQRQAQQNISISVDVDTAAASAALAAWRAKESSKSVRQRIVVEREDRGNVGSGAQQGFSVVQNIGGISLFQLANISAALAGVNAIVAALGGVIAAAGAAGTALGAMGAVGLVGGSGIFKAFSALNQEADNLTNRATTSANEQARALDRLEDAQRGVSDAQRGLRDSQKDYARAVQDATRAIRDQNMELQDAVLSQEDAAIGVARARERLAEVNRDARAGKASQLDVQEARLGVRTAQSRLKQSQIQVSDAREDTTRVNAGGVEGHEIVQNARSRVDEQYRRLADAQRDVARATRDMASAVQQASGPQSQFEKAMARLSPTARDFVERIRSLGPEWTKLRMATEGAMFAGLGETVQRVAGVQLPDLQRGMVSLAGTMNGLLKGSLETVSATFSEFAADGTYSRFINSVQDSFKGFVPTVDAVVRSLTGLTIEIGPQIGVFFTQFADFLNEGTPMWAEFGRETVAGLGGMLPTINQLFSVMLPIARELLPYFAQALQALADGLSQNQGTFAEFNGALGGAFVNLIRAAVPLLAAFARALTPILNYIADMNPAILTWVAGLALVGAAMLRTVIGLSNFISRIGTAIGVIRTLGQSRFIVGVFGAIRAAAIGLAATLGRVAVAMRTAMMAMVATPMGKFMVGIVALGAALVLLYQRSETFRNIVTRIKNALTNLLGGSDNAQAAMVFGPLLLGFTKLTGGASLFSKALGPLKTAVTAVTMGIRAMTVAMISNPIGLIVAAVVALGVALWAFFTKTELGRKIWAGFVNFLKGAWEGFKNAFGAVVDWLQDRWQSVVSFFSDNKYVQALLNPIQTLKNGFRIMVEYAKGLFGNLKRSLLEMLLAPARAIGRLFQKVPTWVPGSGRVRSFGTALANVQVVQRAEGGPIPVSRAGNVLKGPGTATSDSIVAVDPYGVPVARVSTEEGIVNARAMKKHRGLFDALNSDDPRLAALPGFDQGGALDGSAKQRLGAGAWDQQWQKYFRDKGADTPQKAYDYMQTHLDVRDRYRAGQLPPDKTDSSWFSKMTPRKDDDKIAEDRTRRNDEQRVEEVKQNEKESADRRRARRLFDDAWFKWFEGHGGDDNKQAYLSRNPDVAERWRTGVFPPGDERRQEDIKFNPDGSLSEESKPFDNGGDLNISDPSAAPSGDYDPFVTPQGDANGGGGTSRLQEAATRAVTAGEAKGIDVAVQISDPDSGMSYFAGKQGQFPSASVIKLLVAAAAAKAIDEKKLTADQVRPVLNPMISNSSNPATNQMIDMLGGFDAVNSAGSSLGIASSDAFLGRKLGVSVSGEDPNRMTARGADALLTLFSQSARGKTPEGKTGLSKSSAQLVVDAMKNQSVDTKFGSNLPNEKIAHKTGELGGASHDVGYFFDGERWLQVSILTNKAGAASQDANNEIIRAFGKEVFEARGETPGAVGGSPDLGGQSGIPSGEALDRAVAVAKRYGDGRPYEYGNIDCSGYISRIYAGFMGLPDTRHFTTEDDFEGKFKFVKGLVPNAFQIGVMRGGGGPNSHMVGTMPDGTNVESGGAHNSVAYGGPAKGAKDLPLHWSLPPDRWNPPAKITAGVEGTGAEDYGNISIENVDPGPDGIVGTDDDIALGGGEQETDTYTQDEWSNLSPVQKLFPQLGDKKSPYAESDRFSLPGFAASSARVGTEEALKGMGLEHSILSGKDLWADGKSGGKKPPNYDPEKTSLPSFAAKAARTVAEGFLGFFDLGNSIASGSNEYNRAVQESYDWYDDAVRKDRIADNKKSTPQTSNVGSGEAGTPKTDQLQLGYRDPVEAPPVQQAMVPKQTPEGGIAAGSPGAKEAFFEEWKKHGWTDQNNWFDTLRLYHGESGWNEQAANPASTARGIPQFLEATRQQFGWGPTAKEQAGPAAKYLKSRSDYGSPSKAYAMWKSRSPHWYADGGWVRGPGGPRDDAIDARVSDGEHITSADSAAKAGPLLELINSSPEAAENAMNMFAGPVGAAVNAVAPGAGSAVAAGLSGAAGAVKAGARPFADKAIGFLSEIERSNFSPRHEAPAQSRLEPKKTAPPMQKHFNSGTININTLDHKSMIHELDDMQARDAMRHVNI